MKRKKLWVFAAVGAALVAVAVASTTAGAGTSGRQFFFQSAKLPIPDAPNGGGVLDKLRLGGGGRIRDLNVGVRINHTADADLNIYLISPTGKFVELSTDNGGGGNDYGTGPNACRGSGNFTVFNDEVGRSIRQGSAPFAAGFRPESPLSSLNGDRIAGTWRLQVFDDGPGAAGTVGCFAMAVLLR